MHLYEQPLTLRQYKRHTVLGVSPGKHWNHSRMRSLTQAPHRRRPPPVIDEPAAKRPKQLRNIRQQPNEQNQDTKQDTEQVAEQNTGQYSRSKQRVGADRQRYRAG